ncbi:uncharacterized protein LOC112463445, partial [Temnothorax curvispinosus]|uniref:Uncharacterized protein LOC112463445 n=1 Tax=Temnothorax curvispinosus TaxID=300111 RepID=A0A6J1QT05_9HYME
MELSEKSSRQMKGASSTSTGIDLLKAGKKAPGKNTGDKQFKPGARKCGKAHLASKCTLSRDIRCHGCGKQGHLRTVCFAKGSTNQLQEILSLEHVNFREKFLTTFEINGKPLEFEVDSGAAVTVVSEQVIHSIFPEATIHNTQLQLISYCSPYLQLEMAPEDREILVISTCKGLYKVNRLMYGLAS